MDVYNENHVGLLSSTKEEISLITDIQNAISTGQWTSIESLTLYRNNEIKVIGAISN